MGKQVSKLAHCWTIEKTELFSEILADPNNGFSQSLERLPLKKSFNKKVFRHIQCEIFKGLKSDGFRYIRELNFLDKYGDTINHKVLDSSTDKLRLKYKSLKEDWNKLTDQIKNGSGLAPDNEPR